MGNANMKIVPIMKCRNMNESLSWYTGILDFKLKYPNLTLSSQVVNLVKDDAEIQLSTLSGDSEFGSDVNILVENVNELFRKFVERGLDTSNREDSPVHRGPVDQTWGMREFYVTDPNGNTLRFGQQIK